MFWSFHQEQMSKGMALNLTHLTASSINLKLFPAHLKVATYFPEQVDHNFGAPSVSCEVHMLIINKPTKKYWNI